MAACLESYLKKAIPCKPDSAEFDCSTRDFDYIRPLPICTRAMCKNKMTEESRPLPLALTRTAR